MISKFNLNKIFIDPLKGKVDDAEKISDDLMILLKAKVFLLIFD